MLLAATLGLEISGRYGRRLGLHADDVWNTGLLAMLAGLLAARLWNVAALWPIYVDDPWLIFSLRPGGFAPLPGYIAALVVAYANLIRRALDPVRMAAAYAVGVVAAGIVLSIGAYLSGNVVGLPSDMPWALAYFGEMRHPAALYRALGIWLLFVALWLRTARQQPGRTVLLAGLGYSLIRLFTDAFVDDAALVGTFRASQVVALVAALALSLLLARTPRATELTTTDKSGF